MRNLVTAAFVVTLAFAALSGNANAQTVAVNGVGSSALFLELGLGASSSIGPTAATCVWSTTSNVPGNTVSITDTSTGTSLTDSGSAWVAWTPGTGTCLDPVGFTVYAYLSTDSVVGLRCLFNANQPDPAGDQCTISYPIDEPDTARPGLIDPPQGEGNLPTVVADALNNATVNAAGTDIRPEDAAFAQARTTSPCGAFIGSTQYRGLGYGNGDAIMSNFGGFPLHTIDFTLTPFTVTPIGATPILVVVNGDGTSESWNNTSIKNISSQTLAWYLDGTNSYTGQALPTPSQSGDAVNVLLPEPLSGAYNTMEYNVPNRIGTFATPTAFGTSQDVGDNQSVSQINCNSTGGVLTNPLAITTPSGGARFRAVGSDQELSEVLGSPDGVTEPLGYGFWSVANFKSYTGTAAENAKYLQIDTFDPLYHVGHTYTGTVPTSGNADLTAVDLSNVSDGNYPIWSLLRLVNVGTSALPAAVNLSNAAQAIVSSGTDTSRPDFVIVDQLTVVRSHFLPPAGSGEPTASAIANGHVGDPTSACTAAEAGGDVGGVVINLATESAECARTGIVTGTTGERR